MDFLKWYKNKVEQNELEPPEFIWENIQDDLDINQSWYLINNHLSRKAVIRRQSIFAIAASILIIISVGSYFLINPNLQQDEFHSYVKEINQVEAEIFNNNLAQENFQQAASISIAKNQKGLIRKKPISQEKKNLAFELNETINYESTIASLSKKDIGITTNTNLKIIPVNQVETIYNKELEDRVAFKKLYVGATGQLANTWLLNDKTYNGLENGSLTTSNASFGSNWGLYIGTNLTKYIDVQFDYSFLAQNKQDYNEYINGHYVTNTMKFNYSQVGLSFRYNYISKRFMQGEHGINAGGYLGYLYNAYDIIDGNSEVITNNYNQFDYGVFIGYEYVIPIYNKLGFGTGVRAYYGLKNIYSGDEYIPSSFNETKNASINISFSLKYSLK